MYRVGSGPVFRGRGVFEEIEHPVAGAFGVLGPDVAERREFRAFHVEEVADMDRTHAADADKPDLHRLDRGRGEECLGGRIPALRAVLRSTVGLGSATAAQDGGPGSQGTQPEERPPVDARGGDVLGTVRFALRRIHLHNRSPLPGCTVDPAGIASGCGA